MFLLVNLVFQFVYITLELHIVLFFEINFFLQFSNLFSKLVLLTLLTTLFMMELSDTDFIFVDFRSKSLYFLLFLFYSLLKLFDDVLILFRLLSQFLSHLFVVISLLFLDSELTFSFFECLGYTEQFCFMLLVEIAK